MPAMAGRGSVYGLVLFDSLSLFFRESDELSALLSKRSVRLSKVFLTWLGRTENFVVRPAAHSPVALQLGKGFSALKKGLSALSIFCCWNRHRKLRSRLKEKKEREFSIYNWRLSGHRRDGEGLEMLNYRLRMLEFFKKQKFAYSCAESSVYYRTGAQQAGRSDYVFKLIERFSGLSAGLS